MKFELRIQVIKVLSSGFGVMSASALNERGGDLKLDKDGKSP